METVKGETQVSRALFNEKKNAVGPPPTDCADFALPLLTDKAAIGANG